MVRPKSCFFLLVLFASIVCQGVFAQAPRTVRVRILDSKTGRRIIPSGILVRIDHQVTAHSEWTRQNEDGTAELTLPGEASFILLQVTYHSSIETFVNCDVVNRYQTAGPRWYSVSDIAAKGLVTMNGCVNQSHEDKLKAAADPGELVLYVRRPNWREEAED